MRVIIIIRIMFDVNFGSAKIHLLTNSPYKNKCFICVFDAIASFFSRILISEWAFSSQSLIFVVSIIEKGGSTNRV